MNAPTRNARTVEAVILLALCACRVAPDYEPPKVETPAEWSDESGAAAAAEPPERWWREFHDAELDSLVERAVASNLDLAFARARVLEARALRDFVAGARLPEVNARASFTRSEASANTRQGSLAGTAPQNLYDVGFDALWEVDLFSSNQYSLEAAEAGVEAAEEGRRDALVTLLGEVAREYVELRGIQRQRALVQANADSQRESLELTRVRFEAGLATELDVVRAQALLSSTQAFLPSLESGASAGIHRLSVLLGEPPERLSAELSEAAPVPHAAETVTNLAAGLPSDLLRRRPDVRRAERELGQAASLTARAISDLYPKLTIGASLGLQSIHSSSLFEGDSRTWSIGPSLFAPIFQGGRLRAAVRVQDARQEQALALYEKTVLTALEEVESALVALARERERRESLSESHDASRRALELATDLHLRGLVDYFEVLDALRTRLLAEAELARSDTELSSRTVALYKALGGGWEALEADFPTAAAQQPSDQPSDPSHGAPGSGSGAGSGSGPGLDGAPGGPAPLR